ncbi:hypothetical protein ColLi_10750 [Colletotrichum liriopes]|uniref:Extracellular membrane protein CFEM domain-containing protein n=1 Tax=Colletotrichum liriopes TaxID=708192 RepID=A0AA37LX73_9PEZI|nr:hypothetical protein ColLi_10750 [Colletotrichum liriopes]
MATIRRNRARPVLWTLVLSHLFLLGFAHVQSTSAPVLECSCESFSTALNNLNNGYASVCACSCGKVISIPATFTTVFTIYDPITSGDLMLTSELNTLSSASQVGPSSTTTLDTIVSTISNTVSYWSHWFPHLDVTVSSGESTIHLNHTITPSGVFWTSPATGTNGKITSQTFVWNSTIKSFVSSSSSMQNSTHVYNVSVPLSNSASSVHPKPFVSSTFISSGLTLT